MHRVRVSSSAGRGNFSKLVVPGWAVSKALYPIPHIVYSEGVTVEVTTASSMETQLLSCWLLRGSRLRLAAELHCWCGCGTPETTSTCAVSRALACNILEARTARQKR